MRLSSPIASRFVAAWRKNAALTAWLTVAPLTLVLIVQPIRTNSVRYAILGSLVLLLPIGIAAFKSVWARAAIVIVALLSLLPFLLPARPVSDVQLRTAYVRSLRSYVGTPYVWGGETYTGIDCSGLVRCGLMNAAFMEGLRTGNGELTREALSLWMHDSTASDLYEGYRSETVKLYDGKAINDLDYSAVRPGDFAVTDNGVHTLAYLGNRTWIQATPSGGIWRVVTNRIPEERDPYFIMGVHILRWRALSGD
ncbi:MAG TPA: NlpC/P60 family protein [Capsulimonadaceae bacterium]|jgi:hypothetical protein